MENQKVICDTMIWYHIANGKIDTAKLKNLDLYSTYINLFELRKTPNLLKDWKFVKKAVRALHDYHKGVFETHPIEFIIKKQFPEYACKDDSYKQTFKEFETLMEMDDNTEIPEEVIKKMQKSIDEFAQIAQRDADNINSKLPELRKKIKETVGKKVHREIESYPLIYEVVNVYVQKQTNGEVALDIEKYPWNEIELFVKTWDNYFKELEVSGNRKFQPNDWQDIFAMVYVKPGYKFASGENKWIDLIRADKTTKDYLIVLS